MVQIRSDYILTYLKESMDEYLKDPRWGLPHGMFLERSTRNWAVSEILYRVKKDPQRVDVIVHTFIEEMDRHAKISRFHSKEFLIAKETGELVEDLLYTLAEDLLKASKE